jgi:hypothetical protein
MSVSTSLPRHPAARKRWRSPQSQEIAMSTSDRIHLLDCQFRGGTEALLRISAEVSDRL